MYKTSNYFLYILCKHIQHKYLRKTNFHNSFLSFLQDRRLSSQISIYNALHNIAFVRIHGSFQSAKTSRTEDVEVWYRHEM